ncbi:MAG TPA: hypothetical protein ENJ33_06880, partial [Thiothrix sp.]|nr:hypothetical protein [Thiothrix sp.]
MGNIVMKKRSKAKKRSRLVKRHHVRASKSVTLARKDDIVTEVVDEEKRIALLDSDGFMTLGQAQEYWLLGEWGKLTTFDLAFLKKHPDRGRLALLIGSAYQQLTKRDEARKYVREALKWGCSRTEVVKTLLAGVYNVLGRFLALKGEKKEAISFFEKSILCDFISVVDKSLSGELRMASQLRQLNIVVFLFYKKKKNNIINFDCIDDHKKIDVRQLVVLGMHRSGTSCVTGSFHNMGAYFASGENIMSPSLSNPKGFFERIDTMKLNDQALSKSHATWW